VSVHTIGLTLEKHLASHTQRLLIDKSSQLSVNSVVLFRFVNERFFNELMLGFVDDSMEVLVLKVSRLQVLK
jgi:hypothetical protein